MGEGTRGGEATAVLPPSFSESASTGSEGDSAPTTVPARRTAAEAGLLSLQLSVAALWLTFWCVDIVSPGLPVLQDSLDFSDTVAGLVFSAFFAGRLIANLPAAILVDRAGARRTAAIGAGLLLAGSVVVAVAGGAAVLLPGRVLQGTGVSLLVAAALLSALRARPAGGAAMTTYNVAAGVGGSFGLISGGFLADGIGWRSIFWLSALLAAVMAGAAMLGRRTAAPSAIAAPLARARIDDQPVRPLRLPRRDVGVAFLANLLVYINYSIWVVAVALYADQRFASSTGLIGTLLVASNAVHLLGAIPSGRVVRRWGGDRALVAGFVLTATGTATMLLAPGAWWLIVPLSVFCLGQVCANTAAGDRLLRLGGQGGRAVGLVRFSSDIGLVVGPFAVGALADGFGVASPFAVLAALTTVLAVAIWREGRAATRNTVRL